MMKTEIDRLINQISITTQKTLAVGISATILFVTSCSDDELSPNGKELSEIQFTKEELADGPFGNVKIDGHSDPDMQPSFVDIDADGDFDIFIGSDDPGITYFENTGTESVPVFTERKSDKNPLSAIDQRYNALLVFEDIDADGDLDLLIGDNYYDVKYWENSGTPTSPVFERRTGTANPFRGLLDQHIRIMPTFFDIDADGDLDLFTSSFELLYIDGLEVEFFRHSFFLNIGSDSSPKFEKKSDRENPLKKYGIRRHTFVDLDGDNDLDYVTKVLLTGMELVENKGSKTEAIFAEKSITPNPFFAFKSELEKGSFPHFVDIDADGDYDMIFAHTQNNSLVFYRNITGE